MSQTRPVAAITGASSGIGAEFARQLAGRGYDLLLIARRREKLEALAGRLSVQCECLSADLASEAGLAAAAARIAREPSLEVLVNNAGFGATGRFWESPLAVQEGMHRLHVLATLRLTHTALAGMVERKTGAVINVASVAAFARSQQNVSYCATKSWMTAFCEGLVLELRSIGSPVQVQALCPGFTYSEFHDVMGVDRALIPRVLWMDADQVVRTSLDALDHGKWLVVPGWRYAMFAAVFSKLPQGLRLALESRSPHRRGREVYLPTR